MAKKQNRNDKGKGLYFSTFSTVAIQTRKMEHRIHLYLLVLCFTLETRVLFAFDLQNKFTQFVRILRKVKS